jgi:hypothetical protein
MTGDPEGFGGSDEGSHYMATKQGLAEPEAEMVEDLSGGPAPNPSEAGQEFRGSLPTVQVIPPIAAQLGDIRSLLQGGLDSLKLRRHSLSPADIRLLESLARTAKTALELEQAVNASMREKGKLDKLDRAQLEALLGDPRLLRAMLNEEG